MLHVTFVVVVVVYGVLRSETALAGTEWRTGATGCTAISTVDRWTLPALARPDTVLVAALYPAAFGLLEISDFLFMAPLRFGTVGVHGTATPNWIDLEPRYLKSWELTPSFRVGVGLSMRYSAARGFPGHLEGTADLQALVMFDSLWTSSILISRAVRVGSKLESPLRVPVISASLARIVDAFVASLELSLTPSVSLGILAEFANTHAQFMRWRVGFCTAPFSISGAIAVPMHDRLDLSLAIAHIENLGFRTMLAVEFTP